MKKEFFEILNINNFDTQLVPEKSHTQRDANHLELYKNMFLVIKTPYGGQKHYFLPFLHENEVFVQVLVSPGLQSNPIGQRYIGKCFQISIYTMKNIRYKR